MSQSTTPSKSRAAFAVAPERPDGELLHIGQQCSAVQETSGVTQQCRVVDYLPYLCDHCKKRFCQDHRTPESHSCENWDASAADRRAIECPLCSKLIAIPPGEDPNIKLGKHVDEDCAVMTGKVAEKSSTPKCAQCRKLLWQPITCKECQKQFCASHRYTKDHRCSSISIPSPAPTSSTGIPKPLANFSSQTSARSAAAMAALKRSFASQNLGSSSSSSQAGPSVAPPESPSSSSGTSGVGTKPRIPFSSKDRPELRSTSYSESMSFDVDVSSGAATVNNSSSTPSPTSPNLNARRVIAERKSQIRALEDRERKGLLSEQDRERLNALREDKDKECVIM